MLIKIAEYFLKSLSVDRGERHARFLSIGKMKCFFLFYVLVLCLEFSETFFLFPGKWKLLFKYSKFSFQEFSLMLWKCKELCYNTYNTINVCNFLIGIKMSLSAYVPISGTPLGDTWLKFLNPHVVWGSQFMTEWFCWYMYYRYIKLPTYSDN